MWPVDSPHKGPVIWKGFPCRNAIMWSSQIWYHCDDRCHQLHSFVQGHGTEWLFNTLRPRQNGRRFADDTFKHIFLNENVRISIKISLKFVPKGPINNNPALVQIVAWRRSGDKPLFEPMMVSLLTHICVTRPQWVKYLKSNLNFHLSCHNRISCKCG